MSSLLLWRYSFLKFRGDFIVVTDLTIFLSKLFWGFWFLFRLNECRNKFWLRMAIIYDIILHYIMSYLLWMNMLILLLYDGFRWIKSTVFLWLLIIILNLCWPDHTWELLLLCNITLWFIVCEGYSWNWLSYIAHSLTKISAWLWKLLRVVDHGLVY